VIIKDALLLLIARITAFLGRWNVSLCPFDENGAQWCCRKSDGLLDWINASLPTKVPLIKSCCGVKVPQNVAGGRCILYLTDSGPSQHDAPLR
jgi:hypothetical protein